MAPPVQHYGREDVLAVFTTDKPTDPDSLVWAPLLGTSLRMFFTSWPMLLSLSAFAMSER